MNEYCRKGVALSLLSLSLLLLLLSSSIGCSFVLFLLKEAGLAFYVQELPYHSTVSTTFVILSPLSNSPIFVCWQGCHIMSDKKWVTTNSPTVCTGITNIDTLGHRTSVPLAQRWHFIGLLPSFLAIAFGTFPAKWRRTFSFKKNRTFSHWGNKQLYVGNKPSQTCRGDNKCQTLDNVASNETTTASSMNAMFPTWQREILRLDYSCPEYCCNWGMSLAENAGMSLAEMGNLMLLSS